MLVLLLWLGGTLIFLLPTENRLDNAAKALLADRDGDGKPDANNAFSAARVEFSGQEATLLGTVATAEEKQEMERLIKNDLRVEGWLNGHLCPVTAVHSDHLTVDATKSPRSRPWFILSLYGGNQRLDGLLKSPDQREDLYNALAAKLPTPVRPLQRQVMVDLDALPTTDWTATIAKLPESLKDHPNDRSLILASTGDGKWTEFPPETTADELATALGGAVGRDEINHALGNLFNHKYPTAEERQKQAEDKAAAAKAATDRAAAEAAADQAAAAKAATGPVPAPDPVPAPAPAPSPAPTPPPALVPGAPAPAPPSPVQP